LRVAVDHDRLEAGVLQRERRVHAAIVELDALTYTVRAAAQDHDLLPIRRLSLAELLVRRIEIGGVAGELGRAAVDSLENQPDVFLMTRCANCFFLDADEVRNALVAEATPLQLAQLLLDQHARP